MVVFKIIFVGGIKLIFIGIVKSDVTVLFGVVFGNSNVVVILGNEVEMEEG